MRVDGMDATGRTMEYGVERTRPVHEPQGVQQGTLGSAGTGGVEDELSVAGKDRLVRMAIDKANRQMAARETSLQFEAHDRMNDMIVRIIDKNTHEVIREIPSKKILDMVANMLEMAGLLVDEKG